MTGTTPFMAHPEPEDRFRSPAQEARCSPGMTCRQPPVADMLRGTHRPRWYGICAEHLRKLGREVRSDGRVWRLG